MRSVFELLDDCGRMYKFAGEFERRRFNQAIFGKIRVHEDLTLDVEYCEPFNTLLDPNVFVLKSEFEKNARNNDAEQPRLIAPHELFLDDDSENTQTIGEKISHFFANSLNKGFLVETNGLEPSTSCV